MSNIDNKIKKALYRKSESIVPSDNLLFSIKNKLNEERDTTNMKKHKITSRTLIAACILTVICSTGVIASGGLKSIIGSSDKRDEITHYPTLTEVSKIVNYSPKYTEDLMGHNFKSAQPVDTSDIDEAGNKTNNHKEISFYYESDKGILSLNTSPIVRDGDYKEGSYDEIIDYSDTKLYYHSFHYKSVPPEYIPSEEDKKQEKSGKLMIGYGSDKVETKKSQSIIWNEKGITYHLMDMGAEINKNNFIAMAKQVINTK